MHSAMNGDLRKEGGTKAVQVDGSAGPEDELAAAAGEAMSMSISASASTAMAVAVEASVIYRRRSQLTLCRELTLSSSVVPGASGALSHLAQQ